jgi:dolichol-phosphate mannosyltransferase
MPKKKQIAVVVIPTYNEIDSIGKMIDQLFKKTFPQAKNWHCKLLVVDDTSPDGTYKEVQKKQKTYKDLHLLLNKDKAGIGNAYVKGFKEAMKKLRADVIIEFDSDFQHPPKDIPIMLKEIDAGADYVMGSRKIEGGSNPKGWGFKRVFFSEVGGFMARFILFFPFKNFWKITDPTTGLKASRVKGFVSKMDMDNLYSKKFGYKLEFLFKMVLLGANIKEIPLQFGLRTAGESKISGQTASDILKTVIQLRLKDDPFVKKFLKFGTVGFIGYLVNAYFLGLFSRLGWKEIFSWLGSTELAIISNFTLNNLWTFKSDKISGVSDVAKKFIQFNFTSAGALVIQSITGAAGVYFTGVNRQILLPFIIVFLVLPYNWLMYNKVIWKKKK